MNRHFSAILKFASIASLLITAAGCTAEQEQETSNEPENQTEPESGTEVIALVPEDMPAVDSVPDKLPITISTGGDGYAVVLYEDLTKETDFYPWHYTDKVSTLPVYRKYASSAGVPYGVSKDRMVQLLEKTLSRLNYTAPSYDVMTIGENSEGIPAETVILVKADTPDAEVSVDGSGFVNISFKEGHMPEMPPMMNFSYNAPEIEARAAMEYLANEYIFLTDWAGYDYDVGGDSTAFGDKLRTYRMWAKVSDPAVAIQNYTFRYAEFYPDSSTGALRAITLANSLEGVSYAGSYSVMTPQEALDLLIEGYYVSNVPCKITTTASIPWVHLVYRNFASEEYMIPFYRCYVDVTDKFGTGGLRAYGLYDVPAIKGADLILPENENSSDSGSDPSPSTATDGKWDKWNELKINRVTQDNGYYCGPACAQMILDKFGIAITQKNLAEQMPVYWPGDRADGVTGSYDSDVARVLSIHLFGAEPKNASDGGYRVQALPNTYDEAAYKKFCERMIRDIDDGYPTMVQVDVNTLYGNGKKVNLFVVLGGYGVADGTTYFIIYDPQYEGTAGGRSVLPAWQLYNAIISSYEPSYLW